VKESYKSVYICQSYDQKSSVLVFLLTPYSSHSSLEQDLKFSNVYTCTRAWFCARR